IVKYIIDHGADINKENNDGETPLHFACTNGNENTVKYLVGHGANIDKEDEEGITPL
ncbi:hypothetical protein PIROE2DRAFT_33019, partial [Piromyces sp. E2]